MACIIVVCTYRGLVDSGSWVSSSTRRGCGPGGVWGSEAGRDCWVHCRHWCSARSHWGRVTLARWAQHSSPRGRSDDGTTAAPQRRAYSWGTAAEARTADSWAGTSLHTLAQVPGPLVRVRGTSGGCSRPSRRSSLARSPRDSPHYWRHEGGFTHTQGAGPTPTNPVPRPPPCDLLPQCSTMFMFDPNNW